MSKIVAGALKETINAHGPIGRDEVGSASKRIAGQVRGPLLVEVDSLLKDWKGCYCEECGDQRNFIQDLTDLRQKICDIL